MKCPDCGNPLSEVRLASGTMAHRCYRCGGFFIDSWSANRITSKELMTWRRISIDPVWLSGGKGVCPLDKSHLQRYIGESVPQNVLVQRCPRCGKWWFTGDGLFKYKPAAEAKLNYFRLWGITSDLKGLALPIVGVVMLVLGTALGVSMVRTTQDPAINASVGIRSFSGTYLSGEGMLLVVFESGLPLENLEYRGPRDSDWIAVQLQKKNGLFEAKIAGVEMGDIYDIRVAGKIYQVEVK